MRLVALDEARRCGERNVARMNATLALLPFLIGAALACGTLAASLRRYADTMRTLARQLEEFTQ